MQFIKMVLVSFFRRLPIYSYATLKLAFTVLLYTTVMLSYLHTGLSHGADTPVEKASEGKTDQSSSLLVHFQYGWPQQYFSDQLYENHNQAALCFSLEKPFALLPFLKKTRLDQSVLLEFRLARIWGNDIELLEDQVSTVEWETALAQGRKPTTDWDSYMVGLTPYYRIYYPLSKSVRLYGEFGLGFLYLDDKLIDDGTRWHFLLSGGVGLDWNIIKYPFFTFIRFEHFSNGGVIWDGKGFTNKDVIGPETIILGVGFRFSLGS
jgi:hypothetical protein